jgi:iron complex outermembrane receptor protein
MSSHFGSIFLRKFVLFCILSIYSLSDGNAQSSGIIRGKVTDEETGNPLPLANIIVEGTSWGAASDEQGEYAIKNLPPGTYSIVFTLVGYERQLYTNLAIGAGEVFTQDVSLVEKSVQLGGVTIYGASLRNERITDAPASVSVLTAKEIRLNSISGQVPKLLETEPGVDIVQSGINDYNVNTRGFNSSLNRRLLVLLDGRDLAIALLGSQEWNSFSIPSEDQGGWN